MKFLSKIFGSKVEDDSKRCSICGEFLYSENDSNNLGFKERLSAIATRFPVFCTRCNKYFCSKCSFAADEKKGTDNCCPICDQKITEPPPGW